MVARIPLPKDQIARFCRNHRIRRLALFGSVLRDDFSAESDVDVLVDFEAGENPGWNLFIMQEELSEVLGRRVDLNTAGFLSRYVRDRVLAEAETVYERA
jgi:predicted nucleotidyltransferase